MVLLLRPGSDVAGEPVAVVFAKGHVTEIRGLKSKKRYAAQTVEPELITHLFLRQLDAFDLLVIERPLAHDDIVDHARLQPTLRTAICLDESITSYAHARQALDTGACRIVNMKIGRVGGYAVPPVEVAADGTVAAPSSPGLGFDVDVALETRTERVERIKA